MKIGDLRHQVLVMWPSQIEEVGGAGTYTSYTSISYLWARVEAITGLMQLDTKQIGEEVTHKITIRYYPLISTKHSIKWNDRNFEIRNVKNIDERNQYMELLVRENGRDVDTLTVGEPINQPLED